MKIQHKEKIALNIAKEFWDNTTDNTILKYQILKTYINYLRQIYSDDELYLTHEQYVALSQMTWKEMALYNCVAQSSELRASVSYYLGIGLHESRDKVMDIRPEDLQYQRQYKLKIALFTDKHENRLPG